MKHKRATAQQLSPFRISFRLNLLLCRFHHCLEGIGVVHGQVRQDFAVELDVFFGELVDQPGVGGAVQTGSGIDTGDPEAAKRTLFGFAVAVGVLEAFFNGIFSYRVHISAGAKKALGHF